jgi:hypothetical protein
MAIRRNPPASAVGRMSRVIREQASQASGQGATASTRNPFLNYCSVPQYLGGIGLMDAQHQPGPFLELWLRPCSDGLVDFW